ncbi:hypothetical protein AB4463_04175 [Vibrio cyclitrophicus]
MNKTPIEMLDIYYTKLKDIVSPGYLVQFEKIKSSLKKIDFSIYIFSSFLTVALLAYPYALSTQDDGSVSLPDFIVAIFSILAAIGSLLAGIGTVCAAYFAFSFRNDWKSQQFINEFLPLVNEFNNRAKDITKDSVFYRGNIEQIKDGNSTNFIKNEYNNLYKEYIKHVSYLKKLQEDLTRINTLNPHKEYFSKIISDLSSAIIELPNFHIEKCKSQISTNEDGEISSISIRSYEGKPLDKLDRVQNATIFIKHLDSAENSFNMFREELQAYIKKYV